MWSSGWSRSPKSDDCHDHGVGDSLTLTSDPILLRQDRPTAWDSAPYPSSTPPVPLFRTPAVRDPATTRRRSSVMKAPQSEGESAQPRLRTYCPSRFRPRQARKVNEPNGQDPKSTRELNPAMCHMYVRPRIRDILAIIRPCLTKLRVLDSLGPARAHDQRDSHPGCQFGRSTRSTLKMHSIPNRSLGSVEFEEQV